VHRLPTAAEDGEDDIRDDYLGPGQAEEQKAQEIPRIWMLTEDIPLASLVINTTPPLVLSTDESESGRPTTRWNQGNTRESIPICIRHREMNTLNKVKLVLKLSVCHQRNDGGSGLIWLRRADRQWQQD
jgi:hypothetical protein